MSNNIVYGQRLYRQRVTQEENCTVVMNESILNLHLGCWNIEGLSKYESSVELVSHWYPGSGVVLDCIDS